MKKCNELLHLTPLNSKYSTGEQMIPTSETDSKKSAFPVKTPHAIYGSKINSIRSNVFPYTQKLATSEESLPLRFSAYILT